MNSINRHFKREAAILWAVFLGPLLLGILVALVLPWFR